MEIIITDLTRFKNPDLVCTAGVARDGTVIRPMPYLRAEECRELNIHPGGILDGDLVLKGSSAPHIEDAAYKNLSFGGPCSSEDFRQVLELTTFPTMSDGFGVRIQRGQKCIPVEPPPVRSLITVRVLPSSFTIVQNSFDANQLKAHFSDGGGTELSFVSVTDRGFYDYAQHHSKQAQKISAINTFIHSQDALYLRLGLSREYTAPDNRTGYWIQLNGIYTFPDYLDYIRCYK